MSDELILDGGTMEELTQVTDPAVVNAVEAQQEGLPTDPTPHYGIQETKEVLQFVTRTTVYAATHKSMNIASIAEAGFTLLPAAIKALDGAGEVPKELLDLDNAEREECISVVANEVAQYITPDNVPDIAMKAFECSLHLTQLAAMVKRHVAAGQTPAAAALIPVVPVIPKPTE